jgi:hypothetical protein
MQYSKVIVFGSKAFNEKKESNLNELDIKKDNSK